MICLSNCPIGQINQPDIDPYLQSHRFGTFYEIIKLGKLKNAISVSSREGSFLYGKYRELPSAYPETLKKYAGLRIRNFPMISAGEFSGLDKMEGKYYSVALKILQAGTPTKGGRIENPGPKAISDHNMLQVTPINPNLRFRGSIRYSPPYNLGTVMQNISAFMFENGW